MYRGGIAGVRRLENHDLPHWVHLTDPYLQWDFGGTGSFPFRHDDIDGSSSEVKRTTSHTYDAPGTYFVTALVHSHRTGDTAATSRRIPNLAQARIIVT